MGNQRGIHFFVILAKAGIQKRLYMRPSLVVHTGQNKAKQKSCTVQARRLSKFFAKARDKRIGPDGTCTRYLACQRRCFTSIKLPARDPTRNFHYTCCVRETKYPEVSFEIFCDKRGMTRNSTDPPPYFHYIPYLQPCQWGWKVSTRLCRELAKFEKNSPPARRRRRFTSHFPRG